ncbi:fimbrial-like protein [Salmonella enterica]|uniref:fimbrial-like protein n=1 Tax=Salmonella enterica TaxID=28901 RepID=UPI0023806397|nr:fimbrial-like protein [Salmonella enterica]WDY19924.1 fimbrial-like protein [Salmonella enterica subsp. enterica serovar Derby]
MLTRRQCYFLFCSGLATAFLSRPGYADYNFDVTATVINNTCRLEVNDNGVVRLPTVKLDYFSNEITAETDYAGGQNFTLRLVDCPVSDDKISQVLFTFSPQQGALPADNLQVFANELAQNNDGAKNVGVVIFSAQSNATRFNVLDVNGMSKAIYSLPDSNYSNSQWTFYARMQKIVSMEDVSSGLVTARVLVNISYQ